MFIKDKLANLYKNWILKRGKEYYFLTLIAFLMTIIFLRLLVLWVQEGRPLIKYLFLFDYHIHHFYFGVILLVISNFLFLTRWGQGSGRKFKAFISVLLGMGMGLVSDEIGLLLTMEFDIGGDYWAPQSYYFIIFVSLFLLFMFVFGGKNFVTDDIEKGKRARMN